MAFEFKQIVLAQIFFTGILSVILTGTLFVKFWEDKHKKNRVYILLSFFITFFTIIIVFIYFILIDSPVEEKIVERVILATLFLIFGSSYFGILRFSKRVRLNPVISLIAIILILIASFGEFFIILTLNQTLSILPSFLAFIAYQFFYFSVLDFFIGGKKRK